MTDDNAQLERLVARSLVERGELVPTKTEEVLETRGEYEGALPPSLAGLYPRAPVVVLPARNGWRALSYVAAFAAGAAAVALWLYTKREPESAVVERERRESTVIPRPAPTPAVQQPISVPQPSCEAACCAGADCEAAKAELASCPTERTCIPCQGLDDKDTLYRMRLGNVQSLKGMPLEAMADFDLCVSAGPAPGSPWVCEPAYMPAASRPRGRFLTQAVSVKDLMVGVSLELRTKGTSEIVAGWRSGIKVGVASLCKGMSITMHDSSRAEVGVLSMFLEPTYYVELGRGARRADLQQLTSSFAFEGRSPRFLTASRSGEGQHILALGPFDRPEAERLLEELSGQSSALAGGFRIDSGDDYDDY